MKYKDFKIDLNANMDEMMKVGKACYKELDLQKVLTNKMSNDLAVAVMNVDRFMRQIAGNEKFGQDIRDLAKDIHKNGLEKITRLSLKQEYIIKETVLKILDLISKFDDLGLDENDEIDVQGSSDKTMIQEKFKELKEPKPRKLTAREMEEDSPILSEEKEK